MILLKLEDLGLIIKLWDQVLEEKLFIDETVNFGAYDDPMKKADIKKVTRGLVQIPMVGGTIAFRYNYHCDLKLT